MMGKRFPVRYLCPSGCLWPARIPFDLLRQKQYATYLVVDTEES